MGERCVVALTTECITSTMEPDICDESMSDGSTNAESRSPEDLSAALVLGGGGARAAYQTGVFTWGRPFREPRSPS